MAKDLFSLNYTGIPVRQKNTFVLRIIEVIVSFLSSNEYVMSIVAKIRVELDHLKAATTRKRSSSHTKSILSKDQKRDNLFNGIVFLIKGMKLTSEDPLVIRAAEVLLHLIDKLGKNVTSQGYSRESTLLNAFFRELSATEAATAIITLGISAEIELLKTAQKDFEDTVQKKVDELSDNDGPKAVDSLRNLNIHFTALMDHVRYNITNGVSPFTDMTPKLNEIIGEANSVANRPGSSDDETDDEDEAVEPAATAAK